MLQLKIGSFILLAVWLAACQVEQSEEEVVVSAKQYIADNKPEFAVIELKTALQSNGANEQARYLLAQVYIARGDFVSARKELDAALDAGLSINDAAVEQAFLLRLAANQAELMSLDTDALEPTVAATVMAEQAAILIHDGWYEDAGDILNVAESLDALNGRVITERARLHRVNGSSEDARQLLTGLLKREDNWDAWRLLANLEAAENNLEASLKAWSKAIAMRPNYSPDILQRAFLYIQYEDWEHAQDDVTVLISRNQQGAAVYLAQAYLHQMQGREDDAIDFYQRALTMYPDYSAALFHSGALHYKRGELNAARQNLSRFVAITLDHELANFLLASVLVDMGETGEAEPILQALLNSEIYGVGAKTQLSSLRAKQGDYDAAVALMQSAVADSPDSAAMYLKLGSAQALAGDRQAAEMAFRRAIELEPDEVESSLILVRYFAEMRNLDEALRTAVQVVEEHPDSAVAYNSLGNVHFLRQEFSAAIPLHQRALVLEPDNIVASSRLAAIATSSGQYAEALDYYEKILVDHPGHLPTLLLLADLEDARGDSESMAGRLEEALASNPKAWQPRLALAEYELNSGRPVAAVELLVDSSRGAAFDGPRSEMLIGRARLAQGDLLGALEVFSELLVNFPDNAELNYLAGLAYQGLQDFVAAEAKYSKAAQLKPGRSNPLIGLCGIYISQQRLDEADKHLATLLDGWPAEEAVLKLDARFAAASGDRGLAIAKFEKLMELHPSESNLIVLLEQRWENGETDRVLRESISWLEQHPEDVILRSILGDLLVSTGDSEEAIRQYRIIVEQKDATAKVFNNLAYLLLEKDPAAALGYAERAVALAGNSADLQDTLARAQRANGQLEGALKSSSRALSLASTPSLVWFNIQLKLDLEMRAEARSDLQSLLDTSDFPERDLALAALKDLQAD